MTNAERSAPGGDAGLHELPGSAESPDAPPPASGTSPAAWAAWTGRREADLAALRDALVALRRGDLSVRLPAPAEPDGPLGEVFAAFNDTAAQEERWLYELVRVSHAVASDGDIHARAALDGSSGAWRSCARSINALLDQVAFISTETTRVLGAVAAGDLEQTMRLRLNGTDLGGEFARMATTVNAVVATLRTVSSEVTRVSREVGTDGKLGAQAQIPNVSGAWRDLTDSVNGMASNLTSQVRNIALVTTAIANGDLSQKITVDARGELLELKTTINAMIDRLNAFSAEVTRVAREVGTDGKLGGQAKVPGVAGTWKELTDNVNVMASNLTDQVRGIGKVVTAVANGDLGKKLLLVARGEIATLADTINNMTDTLRTFAEQVTTVAREVGIEGRLGGQAKVPGAAGTWRDLTDNVNQLAGNLTAQVRAIADVASAVIKGDLSREITVEARGEVLALKDTINQMIKNLRDTTRTNQEQDWLKSNLARFFGMMQGQRNIGALAQLIMSEVTPLVGGQRGAFYVMETGAEEPVLKLISTYAHTWRKALAHRFALGEGLVGQCALERKPIVVTDLPQGYVPIGSGLGEAPPRNVAVLPVLFEGQTRGVVEVASFSPFTPTHLSFLEQLMLNLGVAINLISASSRTEELLRELQRSNTELETRRHDLEEKAQQLEAKNREIARASTSLEDKARELAQVSQYKSQFLANMSHEIRTPLNSMMILAQMLAANEEMNLTPKQREYAEIIHSSGRDLLALINQILDLSKVEAGRIEVHPERVSLEQVAAQVEGAFRPVAEQKKLALSVERAPDAPPCVTTDRQLLHQILKNLLSNALKFTERGGVKLRIGLSPQGRSYRRPALSRAPAVLAIEVCDTGIGIPREKQEIVFEAFHQADATAARKYGGTGLGLTISREYARILDGELTLESAEGAGSTFALYLPLTPEDLQARPPGREALSPAPASAGPPSAGSRPLAEPAPRPGDEDEKAPPLVTPEQAQGLAGRTILVVDDDARNLYTMTSLLERYGVRVLAASSAREAYDLLGTHPEVDLVLMDLMMPEIDGIAATRAILKERPAMPIVALTAKASEGDRAAALSAGMVDCISKPADARHLFAIMQRYLPAQPAVAAG